MIRREGVWVWIRVRKSVARRTLTHFIDTGIPDSQVLNEYDTAGSATVTVLVNERSIMGRDNIGDRLW